MRVDQPLYAMDLPGAWTLEELEGADRWVCGARELVVTVLRVPTGSDPDRETMLADLANVVAQSRQAVRNFARSPVTLDDDAIMGPEGELISAYYTGRDEEGGEVYVAVVMTVRAIDGVSYVASLYVLAPDARTLGPTILSTLELGPG
ncbi:MAG TPA: hypothetical protein VIL20_14190 [Sandaracinaceae bacterium]